MHLHGVDASGVIYCFCCLLWRKRSQKLESKRDELAPRAKNWGQKPRTKVNFLGIGANRRGAAPEANAFWGLTIS